MALVIGQKFERPGYVARDQSRGLIGLDGDTILDIGRQGFAVWSTVAATNGVDMQVMHYGEQPTTHIGAGHEQRNTRQRPLRSAQAYRLRRDSSATTAWRVFIHRADFQSGGAGRPPL